MERLLIPVDVALICTLHDLHFIIGVNFLEFLYSQYSLLFVGSKLNHNICTFNICSSLKSHTYYQLIF